MSLNVCIVFRTRFQQFHTRNLLHACNTIVVSAPKFDVRRHGAHASVPVEMASPHAHIGHHHVPDWVEKNLWPVEFLFWGHTSFLIPTGKLEIVNHRPLLVKLRVHWPECSKLTKNRTIASIQYSYFTGVGVNPMDVLKQY